jgi:opacity protein-like surface antigen
MKHLLITAVLALLLAAPAFGQPAPEPKAKAPATKVEPATKAPASAPVAKVETKGEEKKTKAESVAAGGETKPDEEGMGYGGVAIHYAMKLGFLVVSVLLTVFIRVLMKKYGFEAQTAQVDDVLKRAKGYAEQWALKKAKVDKEAKPGGPDKMKEAVCFAIKLAQEYKLPKKGEDWWEEKLEAWLGVENGG